MKKISTLLSLMLLIFSVSCSHGYGKNDHHSEKKSHMSKMWKKMDIDKDGSVSKEEFDTFHANKFMRMDANKDGKISKEEKKAYKKSMRTEKKEKCTDC